MIGLTPKSTEINILNRIFPKEYFVILISLLTLYLLSLFFMNIQNDI